jgi:IS1 family transposase
MLVLCSGMQRSGSTLQYELVKKILILSGKSFIEYGYAQSGDEENVVNFLRSKTVDYYLVKTHDFLNINEVNKVVIYSWRDIRDVAASIKNKFGKKDKILLTTLDQCVTEHYKIIMVADVVQVYSSLVNDKSRCLLELAETLEVNSNDLNVASVIESLEKEKVLIKKFSVIGFLKANLLKWTNAPSAKVLASKLHLSKPVKAIIRGKLIQGGVGAFHYGHITKNSGKSGTYSDYLSDSEIIYINTHYRSLYED